MSKRGNRSERRGHRPRAAVLRYEGGLVLRLTPPTPDELDQVRAWVAGASADDLTAALEATRSLVWAIEAEQQARLDAVKRMSGDQIATLNYNYEEARKKTPDESPHTLVHEVAMSWGLQVVRRDDGSGTLYRNGAWQHVYGRESGGFDDHVGGP